MKFKHRENPHIRLKAGEKATEDIDLWVSRAPTVVCTVVLQYGCQKQVLLTQRGPKSAGHVGKWCLPCGYLDWDESGADAAMREVFEETTLDLNEFAKHNEIVYNGLASDTPWAVITDPLADEKQNVCLHYGICLSIKESSLEWLNEQGVFDFTSGETSQVELLSLGELRLYEYAFNHLARIDQFIQFLNNR